MANNLSGKRRAYPLRESSSGRSQASPETFLMTVNPKDFTIAHLDIELCVITAQCPRYLLQL